MQHTYRGLMSHIHGMTCHRAVVATVVALVAALALAMSIAAATETGTERPSAAKARTHIIHIVADDLGAADLSYHNGGITSTPNIDSLIADGVELRHYHTFKVCSPSRASIQTGRYPWTMGWYDMDSPPMPYNDMDKCTRNFTSLAMLLKQQSYHTHAIGKWDTGVLAEDCTATQRGFETFLGYYTACVADYWDHGNNYGISDCHHKDAKDFTFANGPSSIKPAPESMDGIYDAHVFANRATELISSHNTSAGPLYLYLAPQNVHLACGPDKKVNGIQAPCSTVDEFPRIVNDTWKGQAAMLRELDLLVANVTAALKAADMWDDAVIAFASDNGGPLDHSRNAGPVVSLRGGKHTFWEGGVRVISFVAGGALPAAARGTQWDGIAHSSDWYPTLVEGVAGGTIPATTGPRPPDGFNLWPALTSGGASPRTEVVHQVLNQYFNDSVQVIRVGDYKLIIGPKVGDARVLQWPDNADHDVAWGNTGGSSPAGHPDRCVVGSESGKVPKGETCHPTPCLFDVVNDPSESTNLASEPAYAAMVANMTARVQSAGRNGMPMTESYVFLGDHPLRIYAPMVCKQINDTGYLEPIVTH